MDFLIARRAAVARRNASDPLQGQAQQSNIPATASARTQAPLFRHAPTVLANGTIQILAPRRSYEVADLVRTAIASFSGPQVTVRMWNLTQMIDEWVRSWTGKPPSQEEMVSSSEQASFAIEACVFCAAVTG